MRKLWLVVAVPFLGGCIIVAAAAVAAVVALGTYKYVNNELQREYEADYERAWQACTKAVRDLQFHGITEHKDFGKGTIECYRADESPVRVVLEKVDQKRISLTVRVGTFESDANKSAAQAVHEQVYKSLGGK